MAAFRVFLVVFLLILLVYTAIVAGDEGLNLFAVFFGDMAAVNWPGQFNLDFFRVSDAVRVVGLPGVISIPLAAWRWRWLHCSAAWCFCRSIYWCRYRSAAAIRRKLLLGDNFRAAG